jgi:hypothetical protein
MSVDEYLNQYRNMSSMKHLTEAQANWLMKVRADFLPLYEYVPDMELPKKYPKMWTRGELRGFIKDVVNRSEYSEEQDLGWLNDLRLFYIKENK